MVIKKKQKTFTIYTLKDDTEVSAALFFHTCSKMSLHCKGIIMFQHIVISQLCSLKGQDLARTYSADGTHTIALLSLTRINML